MMTLDELIKTLKDAHPASHLSETVKSLWWDKKGNWDRAHRIAQRILTPEGSVVHAYLHREEGVLWNADYWYARAGRTRPTVSLETEWRQLAAEMLGKQDG
jgi:hypothetical protein